MLSSDSFSPSTTVVKISCPDGVIGVERIMLAAEGNLQRLLSAFLNRPITIESIWKHNSPREAPASPCYPIIQERRVHLVCAGRIACIATSTVTITSPECERLLLGENYAIGQLFRRIGCSPKFSLLDVHITSVGERNELERTYMLDAEGVSCRITEVFPDREMFVHCEAWLGDDISRQPLSDVEADPPIHETPLDDCPTIPQEISNIFDFTPHSLNSTPTLSSILDNQAADPEIRDKIFAAYPCSEAGVADSPYAEVTYAQFAIMVDHEARLWFRLLSSSVSHPKSPLPGRPSKQAPVVALLADSGFDYAVTIMALLKLNASVLLLAPSNSEAAVSHLLTSCDASVLIHSRRYAHVALAARSSSSLVLVEYEEEKLQARTASNLPEGVLHKSPPEIPIIVHSSGSTSFPKPVRWSHAGFLSNAQVLLTGDWSVFTRPDNRFLCLGPMFHTMALSVGLAGTICAGTTLVFPLCQSWPPSPADIVKSFSSTRVKTCIIVPLLLEQLVDALESDPSASLDPLRDLNLLLTGGAHCPAKLAKFLVSRGVNLKCIYGSSETGHIMIGSHDKETATESSWNLIRPFPNTSIILKPLPIDDLDPHANTFLYEVHMNSSDVRLAPGTLTTSEETWNTGDVVEECPPGSGWYKLLYRNDDILVHVSGEKTNPVPMEIASRDEILIERIAIIGSGRSVVAAVVQLNPTEASKHSEAERLRLVHNAIKQANLAAPKHSQLLEEMVLILPLDYPKDLPRTPKGNCIRPKVLQLFAEEIDQLYRNFEGDSSSESGSESAHSSGPTSSSASSVLVPSDIQSHVLKAIEGVLGTSLVDIPNVLDQSFFEIGLDSVTAMQLRSRISKAFDINLSQKFVYQHFTVSRLSAALCDRLISRDISSPHSPSVGLPEERLSRGKILRQLYERHLTSIRHSSNLLRASQELHNTLLDDAPSSTSDATEVVAVVGANGSLGIWQVKALLDSINVKKVICLLRGNSVGDLYRKLAEGFAKAALHSLATQCAVWQDGQLAHPNVPATSLDQRLVVVQFDLATAEIEKNEYLALARSLTAIIHTGWKMDFNQVVEGFEDCIAGTVRLLLLGGFMRPKKFYFVSSIGVILESKQSPVPEQLLPWSTDEDIIASPHGYSESKFICEHLVQAASELLNIPCAVARVGQITGDSLSGVWKVQEMNPIIIAGSQRVGSYPVVEGAVIDWVPVDFVGKMMVDLALSISPSADVVDVHHISHPRPASYGDMVRHLTAAGISLKPVSPNTWWQAVQQDEGNPCHAISSYIEEAVVAAHEDVAQTQGKTVELAIESTMERIPDLFASCPSMDTALWQKYVTYWRNSNFLQ
ncbi:hypothetical protein HGRIS_011296 [Hohenbuehelia grisea]|uniref:Carrier domain-containing protein n=1 Tax=Hohenbuehelia grisea TaxID=104357 RepID=A0ABR3JVK6_9AGAR